MITSKPRRTYLTRNGPTRRTQFGRQMSFDRATTSCTGAEDGLEGDDPPATLHPEEPGAADTGQGRTAEDDEDADGQDPSTKVSDQPADAAPTDDEGPE